MIGLGDGVDDELEKVAASADAVADDQRRVARQARQMQRRRDAGWPWTALLDGQGSPSIVELLRRGGRRLAQSRVRLMRALASGLAHEGQSQRQVARRLGITHQRVSAILARRSDR